jgi:hypothetical protein
VATTAAMLLSYKKVIVLQVQHRPVLPISASWEPEAVRRKPKRVNAMIALPEDLLRGNVEVAK